MAYDFKKAEKELYQPKSAPSIVDVPAMTFLAVDGKGDPNTSAEYAEAVELLYALSYAIKTARKAELDYVVPPLEGFWTVEGGFSGGTPVPDKSKFAWTMVIRQPDFVTEDVLEWAKTAVAKKKPRLDPTKARLWHFAEGLCVQALHIGPYDEEPATLSAMDNFARQNGYAPDISGTRRHHEIYLSDPRKTDPAKLKTVLRHPIRKE